MISTVDPGGQMLLAQLDRMAARLATAQREISSGLKVNTASDAPDQVSGILALRANLGRNTQVRTNLERAKSETATADAALQRAVEVLDSAISLASQGAGSLAGGQRQALAEQARGIQQEMVGLSRTTYEDRYLFGGDLDQTPTYQLDLASPTGVDRLATPQATRQQEHPCGVSFAISRAAPEIFDDRNPDDTPSVKNVFAAVNSLATALEADDQAGVEGALGSLRQASAHVNAQLAFYGAVENRIDNAIDDAGALETRLKVALSEREDADITASILELQQVQVHQSAALQARAAIRKNSLFDYLK